MPQLYRRESRINDVEPSEHLEPTDVDDSIVLSDLVRSGEASRLRRRGAMRLDHNLVNAQRAEAGRVTPPVVLRVERSPSWIESPSDDEESSQTWEQSYEAPLSPQTDTIAAVGPDPYCHTLFCGGDDEQLCVNRPSACVLSPLPSYPPPPPSSGYQAPRWQTNGCGAVIHMRASRRGNSGVWVARNEASSAVVPLDTSYFERAAVIRMVRSACGCLREGVGCAICGNPLGSRYKPCQAAAEGLFASRHHPSGPLTPEGPRYWHAHSSPLQHAQSYVYTFFAENVTSTPTHMTAQDECLSPALQQDFLSPIDNPYSYTFFDRIVTASPSPMSNRGRDSPDSDISSRVEPQFDPDGVFITAEPGSPDKIGSGLTLVLER
ncbi:hypothetical protein DEU56DRAFT_164747 [Suillus clintonianus]|uniref:uncharacterized protein n=1 Tax=Suillus clintonianus TaxID=1904413 RepID=UPI001B865BED|nr:uncharacterized protein DEU56DRAFT_164747 [Suillus clintonianus]KAG2116783.1 hypothetical protein DEU56DRAFT_164747 [Suillus clintonianus]